MTEHFIRKNLVLVVLDERYITFYHSDLTIDQKINLKKNLGYSFFYNKQLEIKNNRQSFTIILSNQLKFIKC